jgi:hypothetical protein
MFTPIQQIMLLVYNRAQTTGIQISQATLISTTFTWPMATGEYWRSHNPNSFGGDGWSIEAVNEAFQDLVEMGELSNVS